MISHEEETNRQQAGIALFKDKKIKDGWVLNMVKQNDIILSTSLYDSTGKAVENKVFLTQENEDIEKLRIYISLFEDSPSKNYKKMSKIKNK